MADRSESQTRGDATRRGLKDVWRSRQVGIGAKRGFAAAEAARAPKRRHSLAGRKPGL